MKQRTKELVVAALQDMASAEYIPLHPEYGICSNLEYTLLLQGASRDEAFGVEEDLQYALMDLGYDSSYPLQPEEDYWEQCVAKTQWEGQLGVRRRRLAQELAAWFADITPDEEGHANTVYAAS